MPSGYRVNLGNASLDVGDSIGGPLVAFTTATAIGTGNWVWSGTDGGSTFTNTSEPGQYFEGTDGFVYFVPDFGPVTTITSASVTTAPAFTVDETVSGSDGDDLIDASFTDSQGDQIGAGADLVRAGAGNDTILSGEGNDTVYGGGGNDSIDGGSGDDTLYGDTGAPEAAPQNEVLDWTAQGADGTNLAAGFTQDTGTMRVSVDFANNGNNNPTYQVETGETMYAAPGEPFDTGSSLYLFGNGDAATSTTTIGFAAEPDSGMSDQVQNVRFRINDIDWGFGNHRDIVTVNAFDANGNPVSVTITAGAGDTVSGNTITANSSADDPQDDTGSALIEIAGPVSEISIVYANGLGGTQGIWLTDLHFTTIPQAAGDDTLDGGDGNDILYGEDGTDTLIGGAGNDTLFGGEGIDTAVFSGPVEDYSFDYGADGSLIVSDSVDGRDGTDTLDEIEFVTFDGTTYRLVQGDDASNTTLQGPNDGIPSLIIAHDGADWGGGHATSDAVFGGAGDDTLDGGDGDDTLVGEGDNDLLRGEGGNDALFGGTGNDTLIGGAGDDALLGGDGSDTAVFSGPVEDYSFDYGADGSLIVSDSVDGRDGTDTLDEIEFVTFDGTTYRLVQGDDASNTTLQGPDDGIPSLIIAHDGADWGGGHATSDAVFGGAGDDTLDGGDGDDTLVGEGDNDLLRGEGGNDQLFGGDGTDTLEGGDGDDTLVGGDGDDTAVFSGPVEDYSFDYGADGSLIVSDSVDGRDGTDTLDEIEFVTFDGTTYRLVQGDDASNTTLQGTDDGIPSLIIAHDGADWGGGHATSDAVFGGAGDDTLDGGDGDDTLVGEGDNDLLRGEGGNDQLFGGDGDDTLEGGDGDDTLFGGTGEDLLSGGSGTNILNGGDGNDTFIGGEGADEFFGGTGMDYIDYSDSSAGVSIDLSTNTASGGDAANDTLSGGIDGIVGSAWNDTLVGFDGQGEDYTNVFYGGAGDDFLDGRGGDDSLFGGDGNDTIIGGTGADTIDGGAGDDLIYAGSGDMVYGGAGDDLFIIDESALNGGVITIDGNTGGETNGDRINFSGLTTKAQITYTNDDPAALAGTTTLSDGTVVNFSNIEGVIICFTAGTAILTATGPRPVEDLRPGDMVITRDHGPQPLLWTGQRTVAGTGHFAPIRIETGLFGNTRPLRVSPQHRMLHRSATAALYFDTPEVLLPAKHLINGQTVTQDECASVTYFHLLFAQHQIIFAEGAASESFHPGKVGLQALSDASREDLFARFPSLRSDPDSYGDTARLCLRQHETRLLQATRSDIIGADEAKIHAFAAAA